MELCICDASVLAHPPLKAAPVEQSTFFVTTATERRLATASTFEPGRLQFLHRRADTQSL